jgi:hypothetical protein
VINFISKCYKQPSCICCLTELADDSCITLLAISVTVELLMQQMNFPFLSRKNYCRINCRRRKPGSSNTDLHNLWDPQVHSLHQVTNVAYSPLGRGGAPPSTEVGYLPAAAASSCLSSRLEWSSGASVRPSPEFFLPPCPMAIRSSPSWLHSSRAEKPD